MSSREDGRLDDELRPVRITRGFTTHPAGSVLVEFGETRVMCTASVTEGVPRWRKGSGLGWLTAEYAMLPAATHERSDRESVKGRVGGRTQEISRLIGRSLRACIDLAALGENTIAIDCDVLQADGGTRTAAITGAYVALADAVTWLGARGALADPPEFPDAPETGATFAENALAKARDAMAATGLPSVADDSGLAVDALNGMPGVLSARWSGRHGDDEANLRLVLGQLADTPDERLGAAFVCSVAYVDGRREIVTDGRMP